jgi:ABC-2 type transport system permease protein
MKNLLFVELYKIIKRPRTYIGFAVIAVIVTILNLGMYYEGDTIVALALEALANSFSFSGEIINGNLTTYILLNSLLIHIPILVALVSGDMIAGEFSSGTIRLMLLKPISRFKIYSSKFIAAQLYTTALVLFFVGMAYLAGMLLFGKGDLIVLRRGISVFNEGDVTWRIALASLMGLLSMSVVSALAFMFSAFAKNSIGPIVGSVAVIIGLNIITTIGFNTLKPIIPFFFNVHFVKWQYFFDYQLDYHSIKIAIANQLSYIIIFFIIGYVKFKNQDILS